MFDLVENEGRVLGDPDPGNQIKGHVLEYYSNGDFDVMISVLTMTHSSR